ncbi:hypothetical protein BST61_g9802 [Cercospora zeina]
MQRLSNSFTGPVSFFRLTASKARDSAAAAGLHCRIAALPPVTYDSTLNIYLWNADDARYETIGTLILGKSFLQAAFVGRNWDTGRGWLAQAPDPGALRNGLGEDIREVNRDDTSIDTNSDLSLVNSSWSEHWTPLPGSTINDSSDTGHEDTGLFVDAKADIGAAVGVAVLAALFGAYSSCEGARGHPELRVFKNLGTWHSVVLEHESFWVPSTFSRSRSSLSMRNFERKTVGQRRKVHKHKSGPRFTLVRLKFEWRKTYWDLCTIRPRDYG